MVEDTHDGDVPRAAADRQPRAPERRPARRRDVHLHSCPTSRSRVREAANAAMQAIVQRSGLGALHEAHVPEPLTPRIRSAAAGWPSPRDLGVVDHRGEVFGNEGLFCIDSSAIPTSLGVNPSLTISAVSERAVSSS